MIVCHLTVLDSLRPESLHTLPSQQYLEGTML